MNIKDLEQYKIIQKEIEMLENKIKKLKEHKYKFGFDTVMTSSKTVPYTKKPIAIFGYGHDYSNDYKKSKLIKQLVERKKNLDEKFYEIQNFVDSVQDSAARLIIEYKYIDGLSWNAVALKIYDEPCGDRARKYLKNFLEKF